MEATDLKLPKPEELSLLTKEQLVDLHERSKQFSEELAAMQSEIREILFEKIDLNGEIILDMQVTKAERLTVKTTVEEAENFGAVIEEIDPEKIPLDAARQMGAVKKVVDAAMVRKMFKKGAKIPGIEKTGYIIIKPVNKTTDVDSL